MITRAQAEALLTLAESLEACERLGLRIIPHMDWETPKVAMFQFSDMICKTDRLTSVEVRLAVNALVPKHTGS